MKKIRSIEVTKSFGINEFDNGELVRMHYDICWCYGNYDFCSIRGDCTAFVKL